MNSDGIGVIFRVCAPSRGLVSRTIDQAAESIHAAKRSGFSRIVFVVSRDEDCGETAERLRAVTVRDSLVDVIQTSGGQYSTELLKKGFRLLELRGIKYASVVSSESVQSLHWRIVRKARRALEKGKKVVGINFVDELRPLPISNDCAFWDIKTLFEVGGFKNVCGTFELNALIRLAFNHDSCAAVMTLLPRQRKVTTDVVGLKQTLSEMARIRSTLRMIINDIAYL